METAIVNRILCINNNIAFTSSQELTNGLPYNVVKFINVMFIHKNYFYYEYFVGRE